MSEDPSRYYTTNAIYYDVDSNGKTIYKNGVFAPIGLHIIHKTTNFPDYVFATWEHVDVEKSGMDYINLNHISQAEEGGPHPILRQTGQTDRTQNHPVPPILDTVTGRVHDQLKALNKDTVWQNYRLAGVQGAVVDCPSSSKDTAPDKCSAGQDPATCAALDPNYFMANFAVESDPFLNNFSGPGFGGAPFGTCENTVYQGRRTTWAAARGATASRRPRSGPTSASCSTSATTSPRSTPRPSRTRSPKERRRRPRRST